MDYLKTFTELKKMIDLLESHNKNYTKEQYHTILDMQETIEYLLYELQGDDEDD